MHCRVIHRECRVIMKEFLSFRLDTSNKCLWRHRDDGDDERIRLAPKAFAVLRYLVEHAGYPVTQAELLKALWPDTFVQPDVLKTHILDVRSALGDRPKNPQFIETLPRRRGYLFIAPVTDTSEGGAGPAEREPANGIARPAADCLCHRRARHRKNRARRRVPTPGCR